VVCSICELVEACASNIRSGWKPLFGALRAVKIEYTASEEVNETRQQHVAAVLDVFNVFLAVDSVVVFANAAVDCILCLLKYVRGPGRLLTSSTSFARGKGGNVTSAGWQVTLCDPMWRVSSRSGVATLRTATHLLLTYR